MWVLLLLMSGVKINIRNVNIKSLAAPGVAVAVMVVIAGAITFGPAFASTSDVVPTPTPTVEVPVIPVVTPDTLEAQQAHTAAVAAAQAAAAVQAAADAAAAVQAAAQAAANLAAVQAAAAKAVQHPSHATGNVPLWVPDANAGNAAGGYWDTSMCGTRGGTFDANGQAVCA